MSYLEMALKAKRQMEVEDGAPGKTAAGEREISELCEIGTTWPAESLDAERRFGQPHARLFAFLNRQVWTPGGAGTLMQCFAESCVLRGEDGREFRAATETVKAIQ